MTIATVVIVNYNSGQFLEACVKSVRASDCTVEIIVIDNASTDGSANFFDDLTTETPLLHMYRNKNNIGFSSAINQGVEHSRSEKILLLNPDCLIFSHTIRSLCEILNEDVSTGIVGGLVFNFDGSEQRGCRRREPTVTRSLGKVIGRYFSAGESKNIDMVNEPLPDRRTPVDAVSGSFLMIQRATFVAIGGMDKDFFLHFEDLDLCRRVRDKGLKVVFAPDISIFHYQGGSSEHSNQMVSWEKHRSMWLYQRKHHGLNRWFGAPVFLMVWGHFLLERIMRMLGHACNMLGKQKRLPIESEEFPWSTISVGSELDNRLLVMGVIDENVQELIHFGKNIGWSIYVLENEENCLRDPDVHWVHAEYFTKVPERDAPKFDALLLVSSKSRDTQVDRIVEKFHIKRIAILQFVSPPNSVHDVDLMKPTTVGEDLDCETRAFVFAPLGLLGRKELDEICWEEPIQDCFSWLSK